MKTDDVITTLHTVENNLLNVVANDDIAKASETWALLLAFIRALIRKVVLRRGM